MWRASGVLLILLCSFHIAPLVLAAPDAISEKQFPYSNEERDLFFYQCAIPNQPRLKSMTLMFVGDKTMSTIIIQDNDSYSAGGGMEFRQDRWEETEEEPVGTIDRLKKEVYKINFKLITAKQYKKLFRTTPSETCK